MGTILSSGDLGECDPLKTITVSGTTYTLSPCGLIANR